MRRNARETRAAGDDENVLAVFLLQKGGRIGGRIGGVSASPRHGVGTLDVGGEPGLSGEGGEAMRPAARIADDFDVEEETAAFVIG